MRGSFHGPGGSFGLGFRVLDLVSVLSKRNGNNRRRTRAVIKKGNWSSIQTYKRERSDGSLVLISFCCSNSYLNTTSIRVCLSTFISSPLEKLFVFFNMYL